MLQFIVLFIEIILLVATGYIFWATRKLIANTPILSEDWLGNGGEGMDIYQVAMIREVTTLLTEWQATASAVQEDWIRQQSILQETLQHAEKTIIELRAQIDQVETQRGMGIMAQQCDNMGMTKSTPHQSTLLPTTWAEAMTAFSDHLHRDGYSQCTIIRTLGHVQKFVAWSDQQSLTRASLPRIEAAELETYSCYLETQSTLPDEVNSELVTIKTFSHWINFLFDSTQTQRENHSASVRQALVQSNFLANKVFSSQGLERYQSVFTLTEQGLNQTAIAAQTGLEREVIQLLLTTGPSSQVKP